MEDDDEYGEFQPKADRGGGQYPRGDVERTGGAGGVRQREGYAGKRVDFADEDPPEMSDFSGQLSSEHQM
jgi:hypothetical protein